MLKIGEVLLKQDVQLMINNKNYIKKLNTDVILSCFSLPILQLDLDYFSRMPPLKITLHPAVKLNIR